ncbi:MAG: twin-arginine translocase subunit TatB [Alphaproteobacteria bacterium TMED89]|nr:twin-arginine translocase subunit TatB [Rhodospirillaceae bacterium]RPH17083.1 MAG: twin-arginine translocase subunit TatB [Alphaproteobacteria bacterium TMED89]
MFGLGMTEMIVIGGIALLVVGPKDLPKVFKGIASVMKQVRKLTREFQGVVNDMIRESDLDDLRKEAQDLRKSIDPTSDIRDAMKEVEDEVNDTANAVKTKDLWQPEPAPLKKAETESAAAPAPAPAKTPASAKSEASS